MSFKIPNGLKFAKFNRQVCFNNYKNPVPIYNKAVGLTKFYSFGLVALEPGYLNLIQLKAVVSIALRHTKMKRRLLYRYKKVAVNGVDEYRNRASYSVPFSRYGKFRSTLCKRLVFSEAVKGKMAKKLKSSRYLKKLRIRLGVWPRFPLTRKSLGIRMGKGKGAVSFWHCPVRVGKVILQIRGDVRAEKALFALFQVQRRVPFKTVVVCKNLMAYRFYSYNYRPLCFV